MLVFFLLKYLVDGHPDIIWLVFLLLSLLSSLGNFVQVQISVQVLLFHKGCEVEAKVHSRQAPS